jgi:aspartate/methionine/tyrosine aminotransferase
VTCLDARPARPGDGRVVTETTSVSRVTLELPDFRLEVYLARWEFAARYHLTASDAQTLAVGELLAMASPEQREAFERLPLTYTPTWGTEPLLDAIAGTYEQVAREHVLAFAGAEEAMFWALQELVGPGDRFRVGVGRRGPEPALAALDDFLLGHA